MKLLFLAAFSLLVASSRLLLGPNLQLRLPHLSKAGGEEEEEVAFHSESSISKLKAQAELVDGLSWSFYENSCPQVEDIVSEELIQLLAANKVRAASLIRLSFHDCFTQGCDGSVVLDGVSSEKTAIPNMTIEPETFEIINTIKTKLEAYCPNTVSCADILTLAARDSVVEAKGPYYPVPLGRRDSLGFANASVVLANVPPPTSDVTGLMNVFSTKGLDLIDLVALSGAHTIGRAHCFSFASRLYPLDPTLNKTLASHLATICPTIDSTNVVDMDPFTPSQFDTNYYKGLLKSDGLFTSDSSLLLDARTNAIVQSFSSNTALFFWQFALSMIKMGQVELLTGSEGEIRLNCSLVNSEASLMATF